MNDHTQTQDLSVPQFSVMILARLLLAILIGLVFWAIAPLALGWTPTTVSSGSMEPAIGTGDVVLTMPIDANKTSAGQVALVNDPDKPGTLRLHRILERNADGTLTLKGDANQQADSTPIQPEALKGIGMIRVPWIGAPGLLAATGNPLPLIAALVGVGALVLLSQQRTLKRTALSAASATAVASIAIVALGASSLSVPLASANFTSQVSKPANFSSAVVRTYKDVVLADKPLVFYRGQSTDPAADASGNNAQSLNRAVTIDPTAGRIGKGALKFSNYRAGMTLLPSIADPGPREFSLEFWFRASVGGQGARFIGFGSERENPAYYYDRNVYMNRSGNILFGIGPWGPNLLKTPGRYDDGQWHHVIATRSAQGMMLMVDGQVVSSKTGGDIQTYTGYWRIGWDRLDGWPEDPQNNAFPGFMDDIAIYNRVLTPQDALNHYKAGQEG